MAWMACRSCTTKFAVGLLRCPHCGVMSELYAVPEEVVEAEQEAEMPKITIAGASNALESREPGAAPAPVQDAVPAEPSLEPAPEEVPADEPVADDDEAVNPEPDSAPPAPKKRAAKKTAAAPRP